MKFGIHVSVLSLCVFCASCAPLQQAPLVYSSKATVGLDVSTPTTENPGISINIGVKVVDAAYVPVAVSKEIDSRATDKATIGITPIQAIYGQGNNDGTPHLLEAENKEKINVYLNAKAELAKAGEDVAKNERERAELNRVLGRIDAALASLKDFTTTPETLDEKRDRVFAEINGTLLTELAAAGVSIPPISADAARKYDASNTQRSLETAKDTTTKKVEFSNAEAARLSKIADAKASEAQRLLSEAAKAANLLKTSKTDAYSVYGRFDSNGSGNQSGGDKPTAQLLVGKIFSTGLASQNLTEAVKIEAQSRCVDRVITASQTLTPAERGTLLNKLDIICPTSVPNK